MVLGGRGGQWDLVHAIQLYHHQSMSGLRPDVLLTVKFIHVTKQGGHALWVLWVTCYG